MFGNNDLRWVKTFNSEEKIIIDKAIEYIMELSIEEENIANKLSLDAYDIINTMEEDLVRRINSIYEGEYIDKPRRFIKAMRDYKDHIMKYWVIDYNEYIKKTSENIVKSREVLKLVDEMMEKLKPHVSENTNIRILTNRINILTTKLFSLRNFLLDDYNSKFIRSLHNQMTDKFNDIEDREFDRMYDYNNKERSEIEKSKLELKINKIFSYKDMIQLAKDNGYVHERTSGDHMIFTHIKTKKIVPIPVNNSFGYGIMCKIQRQIINNKR